MINDGHGNLKCLSIISILVKQNKAKKIKDCWICK